MKKQSGILVLCCVIATGLNACGGGSDGGSGGGASTPQQSTPQSVAQTRLRDNSVSHSESFDNFTRFNIALDISKFNLVGENIFLKLSKEDSAVLFLGQVNKYQVYELTVDLPLGNSRVQYEIFTESNLDERVLGEITL